MQTLNPLEFVLHKMNTGYGRDRIAGIFQKKFPTIPLQDFPAIYEEACDQLLISPLLPFAKEGEDVSSLTALFNELTEEAAEKGLQISFTDEPSIAVSVRPLKGNKRFNLYEGSSIIAALEAAKRTTACTEEMKTYLKSKLRRGYNIFPNLDGKFVMLGRKMKLMREGTMEQCLLAMDSNMHVMQ